MRRMSTTKQQEIFKYLVQNGNTTEAGGNLYVDGNTAVGGNLSIDGYTNTGSLNTITEKIKTTDWTEDDIYTIMLPRNINIHAMYFESSLGTNIYLPMTIAGLGILFRKESQSSVVLTPVLSAFGDNFGWQGSAFAVDGLGIESGPESENYIMFGKGEDIEYLTDVTVTIVYSQDSDTNYEV